MYYLNLLEELEIPEDIPLDFITILNVNKEIVEAIKPVFENAQQDEAQRLELIANLIA